MDTKSKKDTNGCVNKSVSVTRTVTMASLDGNSLLPLPRGGMSQKSDKTYRKRKVQWNDRLGKKLVEVLEYELSDVSDSEDEEDDGDSCICSIIDVSDSEDEEDDGDSCICSIM